MKAPLLKTHKIGALRDPLLHDHKFAIPKLQRNFVWDAGRAAKLLDSIYYQMPIGSLFLWEMDRKSANLIQQSTGVLPPFNRKNKTILFVIDGQQRLSVIYQAFKAERRENDAGREIDFGRICFVVKPDAETGDTRRIVHRKPVDKEYVPLSHILDPNWKRKMPSQAQWFLKLAQDCRNRFLTYPIPVVTVDSATIDEIAEVFMRLNSQGMKITSADRAVALMGRIDVRVMAEQIRHEIREMDFQLKTIDPILMGFGLVTEPPGPEGDPPKTEAMARRWSKRMVVPRLQELIATPFRFDGNMEQARRFFESGLEKAFGRIRRIQDSDYPLTVYYAFKQSESEDDEDGQTGGAVASTGWETMLEALIRSDLQICGTWPMRTERAGGFRNKGRNSLASSIILVCRPRPASAPITTRKDFLVSLKKDLPLALRNMQKGNIAPVDLAQAAIGPGMAVFSRYQKVLETDGSPMRVRTALGLINQGLDEVLSELESEFDPDTRWALAWFEHHQFDEALYGEAEVLATAKALSISHLAEAGILHSRAGKVRLLRREELPEDWDPSTIRRLTVWEVTQHLIRRLDQKGEAETANLKAKIGGMAEIARDLAYRLYTLCERKGWAEEAGYYNSLVVAWPSMASEAFELSGS